MTNGNGETFQHTREELNILITEGIDKHHVDPDEIWVAIARVVNMHIEKAKKETWRSVHDLDYPTG